MLHEQLKRNVLSVDFHVSKYAKICDELRAEVSELKTKLEAAESAAALLPSGGAAVVRGGAGAFTLHIETERY